MDPSPPPSVTVLLRQWSAGSESARAELIPIVYQDLKSLSRRVLGRENNRHQTTTALVHDLYLKLSGYNSVDWHDRCHFFSFCAILMRQILLDQARGRQTGKRSALLVPLGHDEVPWLGPTPGEYLDLDRAMSELEEAEPEKARVVELRLYLGCTADETAEILGISKATVDRHMTFARAWLFRSLRKPSE